MEKNKKETLTYGEETNCHKQKSVTSAGTTGDDLKVQGEYFADDDFVVYRRE